MRWEEKKEKSPLLHRLYSEKEWNEMTKKPFDSTMRWDDRLYTATHRRMKGGMKWKTKKPSDSTMRWDDRLYRATQRLSIEILENEAKSIDFFY